VDLDRQPLRREQEFDHDRGVIASGMREPYLADTPTAEVPEIGGNIGTAPRFFDDKCPKARQHRPFMSARPTGVKGRWVRPRG